MDIGPLIEALGGIRGRYQLTQLTLQIYSSFTYAFNVFSVVFIGYQPEYECSQITDDSQIEPYFSGNLSGASTEISYSTCSINVGVNRSGIVTSFAMPCVSGINFSMPWYTSFRTEWELVCDKAGLTELSQTLIMVGQMLGAVFGAALADRFGRKKVYVASAFILMTASIATAISPNYMFLVFCRVVMGISMQGVAMSAYTMFLELIPLKSRGVASVIDAILFSTSSALLPLFAYILRGYSWRYLQLLFSTAFLYCLLLPCLLDESILWLLNNDRVAEAERILSKASRMNGKSLGDVLHVLHHQVLTSSPTCVNKRVPVGSSEAGDTPDSIPVTEKQTSGRLTDDKQETKAEEAADTQHTVDKTLSTRYNILDLFRYKEVRVSLFVTCFVWLANSLYYYGVMLGSADLSGDRHLNFALLSLVEIPSSIIAFFLLPRLNRRTFGPLCQFVAGFSLLLSVLLVEKGKTDTTLTLANVVTYLGKFSLNAAYCVLFVFCLEVFPTTLRSEGMGIASSFSRLAGMGAPYFVLLKETVSWAPGVVFGIACVLAGFAIFLIPETRQRPLPNTIQDIRDWRNPTPVQLVRVSKETGQI